MTHKKKKNVVLLGLTLQGADAYHAVAAIPAQHS
jgi:hypothetical protein